MQRFWRYCLVGGIAAALHFVVLIALVELTGMLPIMATSIGFILAVILNYFLQYYWTFAADGPHGPKLFRFTCIALFALTINGIVFWFMNTIAGLPYLLSQVVATGLVVIVNFQLNRFLVFTGEPVR